jgi:hypothetical protein
MRKYTQLDGYKATTGYTIQQDNEGYIWMGTDNGGVRFDGKTFKELQPIHQSVNPDILTCVPLSEHLVACVPLTGDIYLIDHDTVINSDKDPSLKKQPVTQFNSATRDRQGNTQWLWDGITPDSLYKFNGKKLERFANKSVNFRILYSINNRFVGMDTKRHYLGFYDLSTNKVQYFYHADGTPIDSTKEVAIGLTSSFNQVLTYEYKRQLLHIYEWHNSDSILKKSNSIPFPMIFPFLFSSFSKQGKLYFFYRLPNNNYAYCADAADKNAKANILELSIPGMVRNFFVDAHNNIWVSSSGNALYFVSEKHINNARLARRIPLKPGVPKSISGIGGRFCISYSNSTALTFLSASGPIHFRLNDTFNIGPRNIEALNDSSIFFYEGDIGVLNTRTNAITYLKRKEGCVKDICSYKKGLLVANCRELYLLEKSRGKYTSRAVFGRRSTAVKVTAWDQILVGTPEGLFRKNGIDGRAVKIDHPLLKKECITDIILPDDSNALIGTNNGVFLYRPDGSIRHLASTLAGKRIPSRIQELYRQDRHTFWAATDEGACMVTLDKGQLQSVKNYTFYDGLPSNNVTSVYTWQDTAYIATTEGLGIIPLKDSTILNMAAPKIYIDVLQAGPLSFSHPEAPVSLSHDHNDLRILLNAISYESLGNIQYYYRLSTFQSEWIQTTEPEIRFTRLPPGSYIFEAFATNAKGARSKTVRLKVSVIPAYWQTVYFKAGLILLAAGILFILIFWQLKRREQKRYRALQQKKHLAELELEAIKAQINPHFIYNCLNSIQYLNYKADHEQAQRYLGMFSRLIRMTLQYSQKIFIPVSEEVAYLSAYLQMEQLRFKDKLQYSIDVDDKLGQTTLVPAMLLQPYVENALKHGITGLPLGGTININFRKESETLKITIRDNGPGFSNRQSADALGLRLSATRAQTYNELFNMHITVHCYNEEELNPLHTGAVVSISIKSIGKWKDQLPVPSS